MFTLLLPCNNTGNLPVDRAKNKPNASPAEGAHPRKKETWLLCLLALVDNIPVLKLWRL